MQAHRIFGGERFLWYGWKSTRPAADKVARKLRKQGAKSRVTTRTQKTGHGKHTFYEIWYRG